MAQNVSDTVQPESNGPRVFLGGGMGINDYGIGIGVQFPVVGPVLGYVDLGSGGWGNKIGIGASYYFDSFVKGPSFSAGVARAAGLEGLETELTVEPNSNKQTVELNCSDVYTLNLKYAYNVPLGRSNRNKFEMSIGYAVPFSSDNYTVVTPNVTLDKTSEGVMKMMEPGGLIVGAKFMFGIGGH